MVNEPLTADGFEPGPVARTLLRAARRAALATVEADGAPYVSLVAVATAADGAPLLLLSDLARHSKNIAADPRVSLLVEESGPDPLAGARVTVSGQIAAAGDPADRRRYLARQPSAESFADFADFRLLRLEPQSAHLVAGFGRIRTLPRDAVTTDISEAGDLLAAEESAVAHMNADHAEALSLYATRLLGEPEGDWRCDGLDPEGVELSADGRAVYLRFPEPVHTAGELRAVLKRLADQARLSRSRRRSTSTEQSSVSGSLRTKGHSRRS